MDDSKKPKKEKQDKAKDKSKNDDAKDSTPTEVNQSPAESYSQQGEMYECGRIELDNNFLKNYLKYTIGNIDPSSTNWDYLIVDPPYAQSPAVQQFERQQAEQRVEILKLTEQLEEMRSRAENTEGKLKELLSVLEKQKQDSRLSHLFQRVHPAARDPLLDADCNLREQFEDGASTDAFVMSIDIRRSTDLMLKAKSPKDFAAFVSDLWRAMRQIIIGNYGVFDKFTGDGVLAFFPSFFSGPDAGYLALSAARECHAVFAEHYKKARSSFWSVFSEAGVGVGIDCGKVQIVNIADELTVVGQPVVYACRMGDAKSGQTLLNQSAYVEVLKNHSGLCNIEETSIEFKHDGKTVAYSVTLNEKDHKPKKPDWLTEEVSGSGVK